MARCLPSEEQTSLSLCSQLPPLVLSPCISSCRSPSPSHQDPILAKSDHITPMAENRPVAFHHTRDRILGTSVLQPLPPQILLRAWGVGADPPKSSRPSLHISPQGPLCQPFQVPAVLPGNDTYWCSIRVSVACGLWPIPHQQSPSVPSVCTLS